MLSAAAAETLSCRLGDCRGWFRNISLISYPAKCDVRFWRLGIAAGYAQPLLSFTACWMSHVFHNDPQCLLELNLPSANIRKLILWESIAGCSVSPKDTRSFQVLAALNFHLCPAGAAAERCSSARHSAMMIPSKAAFVCQILLLSLKPVQL